MYLGKLTKLLFREIYGHNWSRSYCYQDQLLHIDNFCFYLLNSVIGYEYLQDGMVIFGNYTLTSIMSSFVMPLPLLYLKTLGQGCVLSVILPCCCHISLSYITVFDIKLIHQRIQTAHLHESRCHHCHYCHDCNVDVVLFHIVTCYTNSLLFMYPCLTLQTSLICSQCGNIVTDDWN